jgi:hypothetical protein
MDGMRFTVDWHVHGAIADDAIIRYKMPCNATLVQVDTNSTADVHGTLQVGTLLPTSDADGYLTDFTVGHNGVAVTKDRGDFDGALNSDTAECPHIAKGTVILLTFTHNAADTNSDLDIALTFLEG